MIESIFNQSLAFLPFSCGIYIAFKILKKADLTVDGSYVLGSAIMAKSLMAHIPFALALLFAFVGAAIPGLLTSLLQYKDRISSIIAGIIVLFILQSFNLIFMGRPNINLLNYKNDFFSHHTFLALALTLLLITLSLSLFFRSRYGLFLRAYGSNPSLFAQLGKSKELYRAMGLMIGNGLVGVSGALTAQLHGYADLSMGTGLVLVGLASILLGLHVESYLLSKSKHLYNQLFACLFGTLSYFTLIYYLSSLGISPVYLKMVIGIGLAVVLLFQSKEKIFKSKETFNYA